MKWFILLFVTGCLAETVEPVDEPLDECPAFDEGPYCRNLKHLRKQLYDTTHIGTLACQVDDDCSPNAACVCGGCGVP